MKKNAMLKIAAILMVAVLLTTCAISSTFAKYVTAPGASTNTARVAKWGVQLTATAANAFAKEYSNGDAGVTVSSQTDMNVMAPGTKEASAVSITIAGEPEVDANVDVKTTTFVELSDNWSITETVGGSPMDYCPIKFKVTVGATALDFYVTGPDHSTADVDDDTIDTVDELEDAINSYIVANFEDAKYEAEGTSGTRTPIAMSLTIGWEWAFADGIGTYQTDARDTLLGNTVNVASDSGPTITFNAEVAVTQID